MNQEIIAIIEEETNHYAFHYYDEYVKQTTKNETTFSEHFASLKFDEDFFISLIYKTPPLKQVINEHFESVFVQTQDVKESEEKNNEFLRSFISEMREHFMKRMATVYLENVEHNLKEQQEDLDNAIEDEKYYEERLYLTDETLDEEISEEMRTSMIAYTRDLFIRHQNQVTVTKKMHDDLKQVTRSALQTA